MLASVGHFPNPFALSDRELVAVEQPITVRDYLDDRGIDEFDRPTVAIYNGEGLMRSQWEITHLADDDVLCFVALPQGGGDGGTDPLRMILMIGLILATQGMIGGELLFGELAAGASFTTGQMMVVHAAQMAVMMGGAMLINALLPVQAPDSPDSLLPSPTYTVTQRNNRPRPREAIPVLYGRHLLTCDYAESPYTDYTGQTERPGAEPGAAGTGGHAAQQRLYQVFCLGQGEMDIESVRMGTTDVDGYEEIEYEISGPGEPITLVPATVETSSEVRRLDLPGVGNTKDLDPSDYDEAPGKDDVQDGQVEPEDWSVGLLADSGGNYTATGAEGIPGLVPLADGAQYGKVSVTGTPWTENEWVGKVVYIGNATAAQGGTPNSPEGYMGYPYQNVNGQQLGRSWGYSNENYDEESGSAPADRVVHPARIRTVYANSNNTLYVRPVWDEHYHPEHSGHTGFHIRDAWVGPFAANSRDTTTNRISIDVIGSPLFGRDGSGNIHRLALGLRFEKRQIDDDGAPLTSTAGEWTALGADYDDWPHIGTPDPATGLVGDGIKQGYIGVSNNDRDARGITASYRATIGLFGTGFELHPLALTFTYNVQLARYEVRGRRTTRKFVHAQTSSNTVKWDGLRAHITSADRKYDGVTTLAMVIRASGQLNTQNFQKVSVIATRKLPIYQGDAFSTSLSSSPAATTDGSSQVVITHAGHGLPTGAQVVLSGFSGDVGGVPVAELNATHSITRVDDNTYSVIVATNASSTATGGSSITATGAGGFTATQATTSPAWAIADALRSSVYSVGLADSKIDLDGLITLANTWQDHGDEFNAVFDRQMAVTQAVSLIARVGRARLFLPEGKATIVRDQTQPLRTAMYSNRNMTRGSLAISYRFDSSETPTSVEVEFMDSVTWKPASVHAYLYDGGVYSEGKARPQVSSNPSRRLIYGVDDLTVQPDWLEGAGAGDALIGGRFKFAGAADAFTVIEVLAENVLRVDPPVPDTIAITAQDYTIHKAGSRDKPARMALFGCTSRAQSWREGMYSVSDSRHRRRSITFDTDFEGHIAAVGDLVAVTHDVLSLDRQSGDVTGYETATGAGPYLTTSEPLVWEGGDNVMPNGGFETDLAEWSSGGDNVTITRDTSDSKTGNACMRLAKGANDAKTWASTWDYLHAQVGTSKDTVVAARAWVKAGNEAAVGHTLLMEFREDGPVGGGEAPAASDGDYELTRFSYTVTDEWQEVFCTHRIIRGDRTSIHLMLVMAGPAANTELLIDDVRVYKGPFVVTLKGDQGQPVGPTSCYPITDYDADGVSAPFRAGTVRANEMELLSAPGFTPTTELGTREPTSYAFGSTTSWTTDCRVTAIIPRGDNRVQMRMVNEDSRVHTADDETYVGTLADDFLDPIPDAPTLTGLTAFLSGPVNNRVISAAWNPAPGAMGYEVEHGAWQGSRIVAASGGVITDGPIQDGETLRAYSTPVEFLSMNIIAGQSVAFITVPTASPHGLTTGDRVLVTGAQAITGTPASDLNGPHIITVAGPSDFTIPLSASNNTGGGGVQYADTYRLPTGASGTAIGAGTTGDAFVGYDAVTGEFAYGDFIAGDTSSAYFTDGTQGGSQSPGAWTTVGWTNATSISAPYLGNSVPLVSETVYVRARGVGLLRGDWTTTSATSLATNATQLLEFDRSTGSLIGGGFLDSDGGGIATGASSAGSGAAQIQYSLAGWFTHLDDTDPSIAVVQTIKALGELPANHIVKAIEMRLVDVFNSEGLDIHAVGHTEGPQTNEYGQMFADGSVSEATPGAAIDEYSATARTADITYIRSGAAPTEGKMLVILTYVVVPPDPTL